MTQPTDFPAGSVWLVGAGPGDPELLTRKAERLMQSADIIFYDALVSPEVLALAPAGAKRLSVGKRAGRHSAPQPLICDLVVNAALSGRRVMRLKGGDPSIFGRSTEEIEACRAAGVTVQVCAGVTTASAAAASLTASLTLRGHARRLVFVTAHTQAGAVPDLDWQALADPDATLAIYMGKGVAPHIARGLREAGLPGDTPAILIENVSLAGERQFATQLDMLPLAARTALGDGPAIILIGRTLRAVSPAPRITDGVLEARRADASYDTDFRTNLCAQSGGQVIAERSAVGIERMGEPGVMRQALSGGYRLRPH